VTKMARC